MFCKSVDLIFTFYAIGLRLSTPFFKLQDFRVRLVQLSRAEVDNPLSSHLCPILNTVDHLIIGEYKDPNMYIYWRVRLVQLSRAEVDNPLSSHLCPILNTVDHLIIGEYKDPNMYISVLNSIPVN
jgi:hypothetical protein